ncbi:MAG: hypothetical protein IJ809_04640 [Clostridia bacterium]|nr:hypothetical protein [Clostridia bacterium]
MKKEEVMRKMGKKINYIELENKLQRCKNINIEDVKESEIDDISNIKIDTEKSSVERILDFLVSCKNPYIFKIDNSIVKLEFSESKISADKCITEVFKSIYKL